MNHKAIVLKQYQERAARLRAELAEVETVIKALGGSAASPTRKRTRPPRRASGASSTTGAAKPASAEPLHPYLQKQLDEIKANPKLSPIQKAQASRKVRAEWAKSLQGASAPTPAAGASLSEAAGAT